jgi:hypothetical protein
MTRALEISTSMFVRIPHILIVDDDPIRTFKELCALSAPSLFDAAIVDYYLDDLMDNLKGPLVADAMGDTPIILVSRRENCVDENLPWPSSIQKFMSKNAGSHAILEAAILAIANQTVNEH